MTNFNQFIQILEKGHFKKDEDAYEAFSLIADGKVDTLTLKEFLLKINQKGINEHLLFGAAKALDERSIKLKAPKNAIDVCGTGGDNLNSLNISTAVSFVIAAAGVPVAKHGNRAVSSSSGSADIFNELGIDVNQTKEQAEEELFKNNLTFIFAPLYHPALRHVGQARKELGVKTIFNYLGPLLNPAKTKYQLIGCSNRQVAQMMIKVANKLKKERCWAVFGLDGMDEISVTDNSAIYKMNKEKIYDEEIFDPTKYGIKKFTLKDLRGKDPRYNAQKLVDLLEGGKDNKKLEAYYNIVVINTAAALIIAKKANNFEDAISIAKEVIDSGKALNLLKKIGN